MTTSQNEALKTFLPVEKFKENLAAIKVLKEIESHGATPSIDQIEILKNYSGWGGLIDAFPYSDGSFKNNNWAIRNEELRQLTSENEYQEIVSSIVDAFYTPDVIIRKVWAALVKLGVKGGVGLEPSCGTGAFINNCPISDTSRFVGIELDSITSKIAQFLNPNSKIFNLGFHELPIPEQMFDFAVANPPYGNFKLNFKNAHAETNYYSVHNQFILSTMYNLKEGSIGAFVVSRYVMDSTDVEFRKSLYHVADLVGAVRLPGDTFKNNANTEVITDILIFRRRSDEAKESLISKIDVVYPVWVNGFSTLGAPNGEVIHFNQIFSSASNVIGELTSKSSQYGFKLDVVFNGDLERELDKWISDLSTYIQYSVNEEYLENIDLHFDNTVAHLMIEMSGKEIGTISRDEQGRLYRIIEQDSPLGFRFKQEILTSQTIWSQRFTPYIDGSYYENVIALDEHGRKHYLTDEDGNTLKRLVYTKQFYTCDEISNRSKLGELRLNKLELLTDLRDCLLKQIEAETEDWIDLETNRIELNRIYDIFKKKYGYINSPSNSALISEIPDSALVLSLEANFKKAIKEACEDSKQKIKIVKPESAEKSSIFTKRVISPKKRPTTANSPYEALTYSLAYNGYVDLAYMAKLLNLDDEQEVIDSLTIDTDKPEIFYNPALNKWEIRALYLSGNVLEKLNLAKERGLSLNVSALEAIIPERITIENISITLGMSWIPHHIYESFVMHLTDANSIKFNYTKEINHFEIVGKASPAKETIWGHPDMDVFKMLNLMFNSKSIIIKKTNTDGFGNSVTYVDNEATEVAINAAEAIKNEFQDWIYSKPALLAEIEDIFNKKFNGYVVPKFDGSHLNFEKKVPDEVIKFRQHQQNAIWRGICTEALLLDHAVGSGKSYTLISIAYERKNIGLSQKPVIVVPNHLVEQFTIDAYRLYPGAKVLSAKTKSFEKKNRRKLFAKIATGDYDLIIMPHSSFEFIKLGNEKQASYIQNELQIIQTAILNSSTDLKSTLKKLVALEKRLQARLESKINQKRNDKFLTFEQLGIDSILVDEMHFFKNLFYFTNLQNISGLGNAAGSNRAFDMFSKFKYIQEDVKGCLVGATGTPISNSAVEMHTLLRYFASHTLKAQNMLDFDSWAVNFCENTSKFEPTETGKLKLVTRFARSWKNMSVLMRMWYMFADPVTNEDIKRIYKEQTGKIFPLPEVEGGTRKSVVVEPTWEQEQVLESIIEGFETLDKIEVLEDRNAERLRLMDRARKVSLAARCVNYGRYRNETGGKLEVIAKDTYETYKKWDELKGTQIIFLDRSVPRSKKDSAIIRTYDILMCNLEKAREEGNETLQQVIIDKLEKFNPFEIEELRISQTQNWNAYQEIKDLLVSYGMPEKYIRFIQEAKNDEEKQEIYDQMNSGEIRVLIGSTQKCGAGMNCQQRLVHLRHSDAAFRPSDIEQREGRIIRQGNLIYELLGHENFKVGITAYVTRRSIESKLWSVCSFKLEMLSKIRNYTGEHSLDMGPDAESAVSMAEIAAWASGSPLMLQRVEKEQEIISLERLKTAHLRKLAALKLKFNSALSDTEALPAKIESYKNSAHEFSISYDKALKVYNETCITISDVSFSDAYEAIAHCEQLRANGQVIKIDGEITGITRARETIKSVLKNRFPFDFVSNSGKQLDVMDLTQKLISSIEKSPSSYEAGVEIGTVFNITVTAEISRNKLSLYTTTLDKQYVLADAYVDLNGDASYPFSQRIKLFALANCFKEISYFLRNALTDDIDRMKRKLEIQQDIVHELNGKLNVPFKDEALLQLTKKEFSIVCEALTKDDAELAYSQSLESEEYKALKAIYETTKTTPIEKAQQNETQLLQKESDSLETIDIEPVELIEVVKKKRRATSKNSFKSYEKDCIKIYMQMDLF